MLCARLSASFLPFVEGPASFADLLPVPFSLPAMTATEATPVPRPSFYQLKSQGNERYHAGDREGAIEVIRCAAFTMEGGQGLM